MRQETYASHMRKYDRRMNTYRTGGVGAVPGIGAETGGHRVGGGNPAAERDARAVPGPALAAHVTSAHGVVGRPPMSVRGHPREAEGVDP